MTAAVIRILLMFGVPFTVLCFGGYIIQNPKSKAAKALRQLKRLMKKYLIQ
jgi:hypothetical protein